MAVSLLMPAIINPPALTLTVAVPVVELEVVDPPVPVAVVDDSVENGTVPICRIVLVKGLAG